jgi:hypothetical protein
MLCFSGRMYDPDMAELARHGTHFLDAILIQDVVDGTIIMKGFIEHNHHYFAMESTFYLQVFWGGLVSALNSTALLSCVSCQYSNAKNLINRTEQLN